MQRGGILNSLLHSATFGERFAFKPWSTRIRLDDRFRSIVVDGPNSDLLCIKRLT